MISDVNEEDIKKSSNMKFINSDIFTLLQNNKYAGGIFFHTRTLSLLPQLFVEQLYGAVEKAGFEYVFCLEQCGISRETLESYSFSDNEKNSVAYRNGMYIHNYPGILDKYGFSVIESELLETIHADADYRLLSILARRR